MFEASYNYKRENDSHMMKNTEWGAVVYLSLSNYGTNKVININNNSDNMTGFSAILVAPGQEGTSPDITKPYNTEVGYKASTTGNITGIYDMSGGAVEYLAAYVDGSLKSSGFTTDPSITYGNKYFDKYLSTSTEESYNNRILGDATGEFGPFYYDEDYDRVNNWWNDLSYFFDTMGPWVYRGGGYYNSVVASQLSFSSYAGGSFNDFSFRLVLVK